MQKIGLTVLAVLIMMSGVSLVRAQDAVSPEKAALVKEFFEVTGVRQNFKDIMSKFFTAQREQSKKMIDGLTAGYTTGTPAERAKIAEIAAESVERVTTKMQRFFDEKFDVDKLLDDIVPVYDRHFTADELRDMIAFYRTPTGQKAVNEVPKMVGEMMAAMSKNLLPSMTEFMKQTLDEEVTALTQKLPRKRTVHRRGGA